MTTVLHISVHMGGGVGKVLNNIVKQSEISDKFEHNIVCLESPIHNYNNNLIICPNKKELKKLIKESDIIQLEWWNHPKLIEWLCTSDIPPIRLLTWCHKNGLYYPIIPKELILNSHICLFTSQCSFQRQEIKNLIPILEDNMSVVYSSGGFKGFSEPDENKKSNKNKDISVGYLGNMKFSKLHPNFIDYLNEIKIPNFKVKMIGESHNTDILFHQCKNIGKPNLLEFTGYVNNPIDELKSINVLAYILNPEHYGTAENALLEAMYMGIVPVVLDNPPERCIVEHCKTGIVVSNPKQFGEAIHYLYENPEERKEIGRQASKEVKERFSIEKTESRLNQHYRKILLMEKRKIDFTKIFGNTPDKWFLSCHNENQRSIFKEDGTININTQFPNTITQFSKYIISEKSNGTVFHFNKYFPKNKKLKLWSENLKLSQ